MNKRLAKLTVISIVSIFIFAQAVNADVLEMKNGKVLNGQYMGGTQSSVRFSVKGKMKVVATKDIVALTFTGKASSAKGTGATNGVSSSGVVPAGTLLLVRTAEEIGTHNKKPGQNFTVKLDSKLMAGSKVVAPSGTILRGKVLKSAKGGIGSRKAVLELTLTGIMINGQLRPIKTSVLKGEGPKGGLGRKIVKGAIAGAIVDGDKGADRGARAGAAIGVLGGGRHAGMPSGTLIEFTLAEAVNL